MALTFSIVGVETRILNPWFIPAAAVLLISCAGTVCAGSKEKTVWVPAPTGSLLGGGYYKTYDSDEPPKNQAEALADAVASLNYRGRTSAGLAVVLPAVSLQTGVRTETLRAQQASTRMMYGDLLVANTLAKATGKSAFDVIRVHAKKKDWAEAAGELRVTVSSLATIARKTAQTADLAARSRQQTGQTLEDLGARRGNRPGE